MIELAKVRPKRRTFDRPVRQRINSVTLSSRHRKPASRLALFPRVIAFAAFASFLLYFGSHLLEHHRSGTSHFHNNALDARQQVLEENELTWVAERELDLHDAFLAQDPHRNIRVGNKIMDAKAHLPPPSIRVSETMPSLEDLSNTPTLRAAWEEALTSLPSIAETAMSKWFQDAENPIDTPSGIPGTGIETDEEASAVQKYLDCMSSKGDWVYEPHGTHLANLSSGVTVHKQSAVFASCDKAFYKHRDGGPLSTAWDIRSSLKWRWEPSPECQLFDPARFPTTAPHLPPSRQVLCQYLRHKHILMIGDSPSQYLLHDLLLDWTAQHSLTCYGDLYCKEHGICGEGLAEGSNVGWSWADDARIFDTLPDPTPPDFRTLTNKRSESIESLASKKADAEKRDAANGLERTWATVLRYRRSDSFYLNSSPSHPRHQPAYIHPDTGIRDINLYAVPDSRRSDVVLISKAPVPMPLSDNQRSPRGSRLARLSAEMQKGAWIGEQKAVKALEMALALTKDIWIPELVESLRALNAPPSPTDHLVVYRGGWRMQPDCTSNTASVGDDHYFDWTPFWHYTGDGPPPHLSPPTLDQLFFPSGSEDRDSASVTDMRTLVYNLQTILQNHVARKHILPKLGIVYLDLESATSIWRSGFVGSANVAKPPAAGRNAQVPFVAAQSRSGGDCLRMCLPSPGLALEEFFIGSLLRLFKQGWGRDRGAVWTGKHFVPVRERSKAAAASGMRK
ncbi:MAG: hypothetical protein CYPHOPRED_001055 [Cyphobasidiales sp. Tagirdzhanova-0007]|nr:MAG: hypothetical protein CYPHOPRED_001055 [Cyphobasidiales sp. Tagirdzhanova-0007]